MKHWQVIMTDTAKNDLREIALGIYEISGSLDTAVGFVTELEEQCKILSTLPETGALPKDYVLKALGYRYLVHKHYQQDAYDDGKSGVGQDVHGVIRNAVQVRRGHIVIGREGAESENAGQERRQ